jgi:hypothetical protein
MLYFDKTLSANKITLAYVFIFVMVFLAHLTTLSFSPLPWQDEVEIIEMGRNGVLEKSPTWSMIVPSKGRCSWSLYYVGGVIQEFGYRLSRSCLGPRLLSLVGLGVASFLLLRYLMVKGSDYWLACGISLIYMVDPIITQSVRGARVDVWTTVCVLLSLILVGRLGKQENCKGGGALFCVGFLSTLQLFIWPSSAMQLPLILLEIWTLARFWNYPRKEMLRWIFTGVAGSIFAAVLIGLPLVAHSDVVLRTFSQLSKGNLQGSLLANIAALSICCFKTPFLCIAGFLTMLLRRTNWKYAIVFFLCLVFAVKTSIYVHRFVHLVPYLILAMAFGLNELVVQSKRLRHGALAFVLLTFCFGFGYSVILRNVSEYMLRGSRSYTVLKETLRNEIGGVGTRIYLDSFHPYYVGRELGWIQNRMVWDRWKDDGNAREILANSELFLTEKNLSEALQSWLREIGFEKKITIVIPSSTSERIIAFMRRNGRPIGYGPYTLYCKKNSQKMDGSE